MPDSPNYQKTTATTHMGTRDMVFFQVDMNTDVETDYTTSNSLYSRAVRVLQTKLELYGIGTPNGQWFTVVASSNTAPFAAGEAAGDGDENSILSDIMTAAIGSTVNVWNARLNGGSVENNC